MEATRQPSLNQVGRNGRSTLGVMQDCEDEDYMEEKSNYLSQIFEGARVTFDVNKENIQNKISTIIRKKEKENRKQAKKKKYKRWAKIKGLLNFFLIMRSELFKRKIQGLAHQSPLSDTTPLE